MISLDGRAENLRWLTSFHPPREDQLRAFDGAAIPLRESVETIIPSSQHELLNSWKEIACYLSRGVRTVQRWEKIGLPVRRTHTGPRSPVMALVAEIDRWVQSAPTHELVAYPIAQQLTTNIASLRASVEQSKYLRKQLQICRDNGKESLGKLLANIAALQIPTP